MKSSRRLIDSLVAGLAITATAVSAQAAPIPGGLGDGTGDGLADVWVTIPDGRYSAASAANGTTEFYAKKAGQDYMVAGRSPLRSNMGLGAADAMVALPDVTGDKKADAMVRFGAHLYLYRNDGTGKLVRSFEIGRGWGSMDTVIFAGQLNGDGINYLLARSSTDQGLYAYKMLDGGNVTRVGQAGRNWGAMRFLLAPGQMTGDSKSDLIGIDRAGDMWCYKGTGRGAVSAVGQCGRGWSGFQNAFIAGDMTGDGRWDLVGVRKVPNPGPYCDPTGTVCDPIEKLCSNNPVAEGQPLAKYEPAPSGDQCARQGTRYRLKLAYRAPMYLYSNNGNATWGTARAIGHDMFQFKVMA